MYCNAECRYGEFHYANVVMLSFIMLNVIMVSVAVHCSLQKAIRKDRRNRIKGLCIISSVLKTCLTFVNYVTNIWLKWSAFRVMTFSIKIMSF
jgi:hypothetical protein